MLIAQKKKLVAEKKMHPRLGAKQEPTTFHVNCPVPNSGAVQHGWQN